MKLGLLAKILLIGVSVTLIGAVAVYWASSYLFTQAYVSSLQSRSIAIAQSLKIQLDRILVLGIEINNLTGFEKQCKDVIQSYEGIAFAMVIGRDQTIIFHSDESRQGGKLADQDALNALRDASESVVPYFIDGVPTYVAVVPIIGADGDALGSVVVGMPAKLVEDKLQQMQYGRLGVALIFLMGGLVAFVTALSHFVIKPLKVLIKSIEELRADTTDLSRRVSLESNDELGTLARAFNGLMQSLQDTTVSKSSLVAAYNALQESETKYRELISNANAIILRLGLDGTVTYFNEFAERFFGYSSEAILGRHALGTIVPPYESETDRDLGKLVSAILTDPEGHAETENENIKRDGQRVFVRWANRAILDQQNHPVGVLCIGQDITEKRLADRELDQHRHHLQKLVFSRTSELAAARDAAEAANRAKSLFLANMSHELRTPMNGIMGMTDLVLRRATDPQQIDWLNKSKASAQNLLSVINNILDIAKIEAGRLQLESTDFLLTSVLNDVVSIIGPAARVKGLQIEVVRDSVPLWLRGDATRLRQALLNYVGNAVKFTANGSITLRAAVMEEDGDNVRVRFEVTDTGVGIPPETLPRLFSIFEQADNSITRNYGGTGLGLAITRRLAELMDGEVGADSTPGIGSTFWFTARLQHGRGTQPAGRTPDTYLASKREVALDKAANSSGALAPDLCRARAILEQMEPLLASDDTRASDLFEANRPILLATLGAAAEQLERQMTAFDYPGTLATLQVIIRNAPEN